MGPDTAQLIISIHEAAWMVRHYPRPHQRLMRAQAIQKLGLTVREAFDQSEDFEPLLTALVDGLRPKENQPF